MSRPCLTCDSGAPCVLHAPLLAELRDLPGVPATRPPVVHKTPRALPHRRTPRPRVADREAQVAALRSLLWAGGT